jgi:hypothetical protein
MGFPGIAAGKVAMGLAGKKAPVSTYSSCRSFPSLARAVIFQVN